ncbi:E3 ubiquitin ligase family protein [Patescibacteria group bacterium]|nr:E3 ubiquitin ligase family protein [Patescibacteria group bacterium]
MLIAGIVVGLLGLVFLWLSKKQKFTSLAMKQSKAVSVNTLQPNTQAEVQGNIVMDNPLRTPFSNRECAYYEYEVEKETRERNQQGQIETDWETVESDKKSAPFYIDDGTGKIMVNPDGATIEPRDLGEQRFRRGERFGNNILSNILSSVADFNTRVNEKALFTNEHAYVFGHVTEGSQGLVFQKGDKDFVISHKSEEEVEKSTARSAMGMKVLGVIGIVVGIGLIIYSFF